MFSTRISAAIVLIMSCGISTSPAIAAGPVIESSAGESSPVIYVASNATGQNNGASWEDAFISLRDALKIALPGTEIRVGQGTYAPFFGTGVGTGDRNATFDIPDEVAVRGGYNSTAINYCCIQGWTGDLGGTGNFGNDPLLIDADGADNRIGTEDDNVRLSSDSPCIDSGDRDYAFEPGQTDLDGNPRLADVIVDIGAYEHHGEPPAETIYVDRNAGGSNNGSCWANAFKHLQDGLAVATEGVEIRVAQGTYRPDQGSSVARGDREATFQLKSGVTIKGGYAGGSRPEPDARDIALYPTILSGDLAGNDAVVPNPADLLDQPSRADNSFHVVTAADCNGAAVLDGFTITAGNANGPIETQKNGGGLCSGKPTIRNCTFRRNAAAGLGGAIYPQDSRHTDGALIENTIITGNSASAGGGISGCVRLERCTVSKNVATKYGAGGIDLGDSCETTLTDCIICGNSSIYYAGGLYIGASGSEVILTRCTFSGNSSKGNGGAVYVFGCTCGAYAEYNQCEFVANSSGDNGGAVYTDGYAQTVLCSCLLNGNTARKNGGAIADGGDGATVTTNCTILNNSADDGYAASYTADPLESRSLRNSIIWGNFDSNGPTDDNGHVVTFGTGSGPVVNNCIEAWSVGGDTNFALNPLFVDMDGPDDIRGNEDDNLRLLRDSPCINRGINPAPSPDDKDLDGKLRIMGGRIDLGAYEFEEGTRQPQYDIIDLGTLGGEDSQAHAINNYGQIVGWASDSNNAPTACLFDFSGPGKNRKLDGPNQVDGCARSINIHGDIVGGSRPDWQSSSHATVFNPSDPLANVDLNGASVRGGPGR